MGDVSNFLEACRIWCSMVSIAFWHLFCYWNRPKNETVPEKKKKKKKKKIDSDKGGSVWVKKIPLWVINFVLYPFWCFLMLTCIFLRSKNPFFLKFRKNRITGNRWNGYFMSISSARALCSATPISVHILMFFKCSITGRPCKSTFWK